jgi:hypothetical protein
MINIAPLSLWCYCSMLKQRTKDTVCGIKKHPELSGMRFYCYQGHFGAKKQDQFCFAKWMNGFRIQTACFSVQPIQPENYGLSMGESQNNFCTGGPLVIVQVHYFHQKIPLCCGLQHSQTILRELYPF